MKRSITASAAVCAFCISLFLASCGTKTDRVDNHGNDVPEALQDDKQSGSAGWLSKRGYDNDLVEELYEELVAESPELKKMEDDLKALYDKQNKAEEKFANYNNKSSNYYSRATYKIADIKDTVLQQRMTNLIEGSQKKYEAKTSEHNAYLKQMAENNAKINDVHAAMKIILTLSVIEKYQNDNISDKKELKEFVKEQAALIARMNVYIK